MSRRLTIAATVLAGTFSSLANHAVAACYVEQLIPGKIACEATESTSADFALGRDTTPDRIVRVEIECPNKFTPGLDHKSGDYYDGVDKGGSSW